MQKIFSQELRFKDENGNDYPNWRTIELKNILENIVDNRGKHQIMLLVKNILY